jgi:hypothetical protein
MNGFCSSCGMPLKGENGKDFRGDFCLYCSDESGALYPAETVQRSIADWLREISCGEGSADFMERAKYYMKSMPAWANEK